MNAKRNFLAALVILCIFPGISNAQTVIVGTNVIGLTRSSSDSFNYSPSSGTNYAIGYNALSFYSELNGQAAYLSGYTGIRFFSNGSCNMFLDNNGNLGIGTMSPKSLLAVNGRISAQSVVITATGWPDYVFSPIYQLRPLSNIATYVNQNSHLPDMPSEKQIVRDGVNLAEMDKILVKKIEELTLYLIDQNRQIEIANSRIKMLELKIKNKRKSRIK